jgi:hypothetical protein
MRKTINDVAEEQKRKKSHDEHRNKFHCQDVTEILYTLKIKQYAIENYKNAYPKNNTNYAVHENTYPAVFFIVRPQTVDGGKYSRP